MLIKIVGWLTFVFVFGCNGFVFGFARPARQIRISRNVTVHRNGPGKPLRLLALLKGTHHASPAYPFIMSRLMRASFEFEVKPFPLTATPAMVTAAFPAGSSAMGLNSIDSVFHFEDNDQQSSPTIGVSNQVAKGPDERDEMAVDLIQQNQTASKDPSEAIPPPAAEAEKPERVLRHVYIQPRPRVEPNKAGEAENQSANENDEKDDKGDTIQADTVSQTTAATAAATETTTETAEQESSSSTSASSSSTLTNIQQVTDAPLPSQWLGYYDYGVHKPDYIHGIEFTTDYPSHSVTEDFHYVNYQSPFKPSLPDYSKTYFSNFFSPLKYFKR